ncbi:MAG: multicopper oxidase family protein [Pseudorhodoplanes sp.]
MTNPLRRLRRTDLTRRSLLSCAPAVLLAARGSVRTAQAQEGAAVLRAARGPSSLAGADAVVLDAFGGQIPGPLLRAAKGIAFNVNIINDLIDSIEIRWPGLRGVPGDMAAPGTQSRMTLRPPDSGTFWYRTWPRRAGAPAAGLYGFLLVDDPQRPDADDEIPLALDAWTLAPGRSLVRINGQASLTRPVRAGDRLYLRLLNAASDRAMVVRLDAPTIWVMALDGQAAEPFIAREGRLALAPGNRADLFVDAPEPGGSITLSLDDGAQGIALAKLVAGPGPASRRRTDPPRPLPANALPARIDFRHAVRPEIQLGNVPGAAPSFTVRRGRPVILTLTNPAEPACAVHVAGHAFRLLDRLDDGWKPFWLDTVMVMPGRTERVAFVADMAGRWPIEVTPLGGGRPEAWSFEVS